MFQMVRKIATPLLVLVATMTQLPAAPPQPDAESYKQQAIEWLDRYAKVQVLFHKDDLAKVRQKLVDGSEEDAKQWWSETEEVRAALDSPEWKDTQAWLREFLAVQAIYSDEEIAALRTESKETVNQPEQFKDLLMRIVGIRGELTQGAATSRSLQAQKVAIADAYRREQMAARRAARSSASPPNTANPPVTRRQPRRPVPPIVDSLDIARWSIFRSFWLND